MRRIDTMYFHRWGYKNGYFLNAVITPASEDLLVSGRNGAGKTSLLSGIFMALSPDLRSANLSTSRSPKGYLSYSAGKPAVVAISFAGTRRHPPETCGHVAWLNRDDGVERDFFAGPTDAFDFETLANLDSVDAIREHFRAIADARPELGYWRGVSEPYATRLEAMDIKAATVRQMMNWSRSEAAITTALTSLRNDGDLLALLAQLTVDPAESDTIKREAQLALDATWRAHDSQAKMEKLETASALLTVLLTAARARDAARADKKQTVAQIATHGAWLTHARDTLTVANETRRVAIAGNRDAIAERAEAIRQIERAMPWIEVELCDRDVAATTAAHARAVAEHDGVNDRLERARAAVTAARIVNEEAVIAEMTARLERQQTKDGPLMEEETRLLCRAQATIQRDEAAVKAALDVATADLVDAERRIQDADAEMAKAQRQWHMAEGRLENQEARRKSLEASLPREMSVERAAADARARHAEAQEAHTTSVDALARLDADRARLDADIKAARREAARLDADIPKIRRDHAALLDEQAALKAEDAVIDCGDAPLEAAAVMLAERRKTLTLRHGELKALRKIENDRADQIERDGAVTTDDVAQAVLSHLARDQIAADLALRRLAEIAPGQVSDILRRAPALAGGVALAPDATLSDAARSLARQKTRRPVLVIDNAQMQRLVDAAASIEAREEALDSALGMTGVYVTDVIAEAVDPAAAAASIQSARATARKHGEDAERAEDSVRGLDEILRRLTRYDAGRIAALGAQLAEMESRAREFASAIEANVLRKASADDQAGALTIQRDGAKARLSEAVSRMEAARRMEAIAADLRQVEIDVAATQAHRNETAARIEELTTAIAAAKARKTEVNRRKAPLDTVVRRLQALDVRRQAMGDDLTLVMLVASEAAGLDRAIDAGGGAILAAIDAWEPIWRELDTRRKNLANSEDQHTLITAQARCAMMLDSWPDQHPTIALEAARVACRQGEQNEIPALEIDASLAGVRRVALRDERERASSRLEIARRSAKGQKPEALKKVADLSVFRREEERRKAGLEQDVRDLGDRSVKLEAEERDADRMIRDHAKEISHIHRRGIAIDPAELELIAQGIAIRAPGSETIDLDALLTQVERANERLRDAESVVSTRIDSLRAMIETPGAAMVERIADLKANIHLLDQPEPVAKCLDAISNQLLQMRNIIDTHTLSLDGAATAIALRAIEVARIGKRMSACLYPDGTRAAGKPVMRGRWDALLGSQAVIDATKAWIARLSKARTQNGLPARITQPGVQIIAEILDRIAAEAGGLRISFTHWDGAGKSPLGKLPMSGGQNIALTMLFAINLMKVVGGETLILENIFAGLSDVPMIGSIGDTLRKCGVQLITFSDTRDPVAREMFVRHATLRQTHLLRRGADIIDLTEVVEHQVPQIAA